MESRKSVWGCELMWPDEIAHEWAKGWVSRGAVPDSGEALRIAARELGEPRYSLCATPVLMREESEVEAKINGHEFPLWVECTKRARAPEQFWRINSVA